MSYRQIYTYVAVCDKKNCGAYSEKFDIDHTIPSAVLPYGWSMEIDDYKGRKIYCPKHGT